MRNPAFYMGILLYLSFGATCVHLGLLFRYNHAMVQHNINGVLTTCIIHPGLSDHQFHELRIVHNITHRFVATQQVISIKPGPVASRARDFNYNLTNRGLPLVIDHATRVLVRWLFTV